MSIRVDRLIDISKKKVKSIRVKRKCTLASLLLAFFSHGLHRSGSLTDPWQTMHCRDNAFYSKCPQGKLNTNKLKWHWRYILVLFISCNKRHLHP